MLLFVLAAGCGSAVDSGFSTALDGSSARASGEASISTASHKSSMSRARS